MALLNIEFVILIIKLLVCVVPGVLAIFLLASSEDYKRWLRGIVCNKLFGVSNVIEFPKFVRFITFVSVLAILYSLLASWFLLFRNYF